MSPTSVVALILMFAFHHGEFELYALSGCFSTATCGPLKDPPERHRSFIMCQKVSHRILSRVRTFMPTRDCYTAWSGFRESHLAFHPYLVKRDTESGNERVVQIITLQTHTD